MPKDAAREWAYDRDSHIGRLDEAKAKGWTVVSMKERTGKWSFRRRRNEVAPRERIRFRLPIASGFPFSQASGLSFSIP